jgi:hypothetical protein
VTELMSNVSFSVMLAGGMLLFGGGVLVANLNDQRNVMHPGGRSGRLRDELLVMGPIAPLLLMILGGAIAPHLRDASWWFPVLLGLAITGFAVSFSPPGRRARARLQALKGSPPQ